MMRPFRPRFYKLDDGEIIQCESHEWAAWAAEYGTTIARTRVRQGVVSTIFLGFDHQRGHGPPILFETMIFGTKHDGQQVRTATLAQARDVHTRLCKFLLEDGRNPNRANGGKVTASKLSPEQRKVKARKAALARWGKK